MPTTPPPTTPAHVCLVDNTEQQAPFDLSKWADFASFVQLNEQLMEDQCRVNSASANSDESSTDSDRVERIVRLRHLYQLQIGKGLFNCMFRDPSKLVAHHIDSYNQYVRYYLPLIFDQLSPKVIYLDYHPACNKYSTEIRLFFSNVQYQRPFIVENSGMSRVITPALCNQRGIYYGSGMYADICIQVTTFSGEQLDAVTVESELFPQSADWKDSNSCEIVLVLSVQHFIQTGSHRAWRRPRRHGCLFCSAKGKQDGNCPRETGREHVGVLSPNQVHPCGQSEKRRHHPISSSKATVGENHQSIRHDWSPHTRHFLPFQAGYSVVCALPCVWCGI